MKGAYVARVTLQTQLHKLSKQLGKVGIQLRRRVLRDQKQNLATHHALTITPSVYMTTHLHGMQLCIRRLALCELDSCDSQRPNVRLVVVPTLFDDLGRHPVWRTCTPQTATRQPTEKREPDVQAKHKNASGIQPDDHISKMSQVGQQARANAHR